MFVSERTQGVVDRSQIILHGCNPFGRVRRRKNKPQVNNEEGSPDYKQSNRKQAGDAFQVYRCACCLFHFSNPGPTPPGPIPSRLHMGEFVDAPLGRLGEQGTATVTRVVAQRRDPFWSNRVSPLRGRTGRSAPWLCTLEGDILHPPSGCGVGLLGRRGLRPRAILFDPCRGHEADFATARATYGDVFANLLGSPQSVWGRPRSVLGSPQSVRGRPGIVPGRPGIVPGRPGIVSGRPGIVPGRPGIFPGRLGIVPGHPGIVPGRMPARPVLSWACGDLAGMADAFNAGSSYKK
jgi:hypothetical protein